MPIPSPQTNSSQRSPRSTHSPEPGDGAPDFVLPETGNPPIAGKWLSGLRGTARVIAFHPSHWDPARAHELASYRTTDGDHPILVANDSAAAELYGVAGGSAVFVVDAHGRVAWRHIHGVDSIDGNARAAANKSEWTRREFVATAIGAALASALEPSFKHAVARAEAVRTHASVGGPQQVTLNVNGKTLSLTIEPRVTLLDALGEYAGLTGTKKGCDHGQCGACTVHIDGRRTLSCLTFAVMQQGKTITSIEGLATGDTLHPMQQAFIDHDGFQCGYCTSGQIMSAVGVLHEPWGDGDDDVREAMSGNICRCGAYPGIVSAVQDVRHKGGGQTR